MASSSSSLSIGPKKRLLFLHGMAIPPSYYKEKVAKELFQALKDDNYEIEFAYSPRALTANLPGLDEMFPDLKREEMREWINSHANDDGTKRYDGLQESLNFLKQYIEERPRFDVIGGHSNGALMAAIIAFYMQQQEEEQDDNNNGWLSDATKKCSSLFLCNAPGPFDTEQTLAELIKTSNTGPVVDLPSLHVFGGPTDYTYEGQKALQKIHFPNKSIIVQHDVGHFIPTDPEIIQNIVTKLNETFN